MTLQCRYGNHHQPTANFTPELTAAMAEHLEIRQRYGAANDALEALLSDEAERAAVTQDRQLAADAARAHRDVDAVGTPAQDQLKADREKAALLVQALADAHDRMEPELEDLFRDLQFDEVLSGRVELAAAQAGYRKALDQLEKARNRYAAAAEIVRYLVDAADMAPLECQHVYQPGGNPPPLPIERTVNNHGVPVPFVELRRHLEAEINQPERMMLVPNGHGRYFDTYPDKVALAAQRTARAQLEAQRRSVQRPKPATVANSAETPS